MAGAICQPNFNTPAGIPTSRNSLKQPETPPSTYRSPGLARRRHVQRHVVFLTDPVGLRVHVLKLPDLVGVQDAVLFRYRVAFPPCLEVPTQQPVHQELGEMRLFFPFGVEVAEDLKDNP